MAGKGQPKTGGRVAGTPNKATAALREMAREHTEDAVRTLVAIMDHGEAEASRIAAARELLDRGYGKASQPLSSDPDNPLQTSVTVSFIKATGE